MSYFCDLYSSCVRFTLAVILMIPFILQGGSDAAVTAPAARSIVGLREYPRIYSASPRLRRSMMRLSGTSLFRSGSIELDKDGNLILNSDSVGGLEEGPDGFRIKLKSGGALQTDSTGTSVKETELTRLDANLDIVFKSYTNATRPAAATAGRTIFNTDDGNLNIDTGSGWILPDGTAT